MKIIDRWIQPPWLSDFSQQLNLMALLGQITKGKRKERLVKERRKIYWRTFIRIRGEIKEIIWYVGYIECIGLIGNRFQRKFDGKHDQCLENMIQNLQLLFILQMTWRCTTWNGSRIFHCETFCRGIVGRQKIK